METWNSFANLGLACHRFKWKPFWKYERTFNKIPLLAPQELVLPKAATNLGVAVSTEIPQKNDRFTVAFSEAFFCWAMKHSGCILVEKNWDWIPWRCYMSNFEPDFYWSEIFEAYLNFLLEDIRIFTDILRFYRQFLSSVEKRPALNWLKWELRPRAAQNAAMLFSPNFLVHKISSKSFQSMIQRLCGKKPSAWETTVESFFNHWVIKYPTKCSPPICCFLFRIRQKQQEKPFWRQNGVGASSKQRHFLALHCVKGINPRSSDASLCWPSWSISIFHIYAGKKGVCWRPLLWWISSGKSLANSPVEI